MAWTTQSDIQATFVSVVTQASKVLKKPNALLKTVVIDSGKPGEGYKEVGNTVQYTWAKTNSANVTNIGRGSHSPSDISTGSKSIVLDTKLSSSRYVTTFDITTGDVDDLINFALAPAIEEVTQKANDSIGALMTAAKFGGSNTSITSGDDYVTRSDLTKGYMVLRNLGVPIVYGDLFFASKGLVVAKMANTAEFSQAAYVGDQTAQNFQVDALPLRFINTIAFAEDSVPSPAANTYNGLLYHRGAIVCRTAYEAPANTPGILETYVNANGLPIKVTVGHNQLADAKLVTASVLMGLDVVRPEFGQIFVTT